MPEQEPQDHQDGDPTARARQSAVDVTSSAKHHVSTAARHVVILGAQAAVLAGLAAGGDPGGFTSLTLSGPL